jgi:hypothetical protein
LCHLIVEGAKLPADESRQFKGVSGWRCFHHWLPHPQCELRFEFATYDSSSFYTGRPLTDPNCALWCLVPVRKRRCCRAHEQGAAASRSRSGPFDAREGASVGQCRRRGGSVAKQPPQANSSIALALEVLGPDSRPHRLSVPTPMCSGQALLPGLTLARLPPGQQL